MNHHFYFFLILFSLLSVASCSDGKEQDEPKVEPAMLEVAWEFNSIEDWVYFHQDTATVTQWAITDGKLALTTRANTYDRTKMHTPDDFYGVGTYYWRTFVPEINPGDQVSIGSWLYHDDHHEIDFEVGYGTAAVRSQIGAKEGQLVACMTNQDFPYKSAYTTIEPGWHDFEIILSERKNGCYTAVWKIDGAQKQILELQFGPEYGFLIHCSIENLRFLGDHIATADYTTLFDRVTFKGYKSYK